MPWLQAQAPSISHRVTPTAPPSGALCGTSCTSPPQNRSGCVLAIHPAYAYGSKASIIPNAYPEVDGSCAQLPASAQQCSKHSRTKWCTALQVACQAPKPILLDTGSVHLPYSWQPAVIEISIFRVGQVGIFFLSVCHNWFCCSMYIILQTAASSAGGYWWFALAAVSPAEPGLHGCISMLVLMCAASDTGGARGVHHHGGAPPARRSA